MRRQFALLAAIACASLARAQGQSQLEHVPPDPPKTHVHDMSYREMVEMMGMDDRRRFGKVMLDRLEWQDADEGSHYAWDAEAWYGGDFHKVYLQAEGERAEGSTQESRLELGWDRIVSAWWSVRAGWRHDAGLGPARDWAGFGVAGTAPGIVEVEASVYLGESGRGALRLAAARDVLLTQRLVLRPKVELNACTEDDAERGIGAGLSDAALGLRLRYEIRREFAPYLGILWSWSEGTAEESSEFSAVAGLRVWF